jgi:hypothetical protein
MSSKTFGTADWVELFRAIGLDDTTMHRWHAEFESRYPGTHQSFLEWLRVPAPEIDRIRGASRTDWRG